MTDPKNQEAHRKTLQDSLEEIEEYLNKTEESAEAVSPDKSLGRLSRMEAMQDQQLILEARRRKKMQKVAVLSALQRIENGQFGIVYFAGRTLIPSDWKWLQNRVPACPVPSFLAVGVRFLYDFVSIEPGGDCS